MSLHGRFWTDDAATAAGLVKAAGGSWYVAMAKNQGFLGGALLVPTAASVAAEGSAGDYDLSYACETVSFWQTEADRAAWTRTEPHDAVFADVTSRAASRESHRQTLQYWAGSLDGAGVCDTGTHWAQPGQEAEMQSVISGFAESASSAPGFCAFAMMCPLPPAERMDGHDWTFETKVFWRSDADRVAWRATWAGGALSMRGRAAARLDKKRAGLLSVVAAWPAFDAHAAAL